MSAKKSKTAAAVNENHAPDYLVLHGLSYRKYQTLLNNLDRGLTVEQNESVTVPDQTMSLRNLLTRYSADQVITGQEPIYLDDFYPDFKTMDLVEIQNYRENAQADIEVLVSRMDAATRAMAQKEGVLPHDLSGFPEYKDPTPKPEEPQRVYIVNNSAEGKNEAEGS